MYSLLHSCLRRPVVNNFFLPFSSLALFSFFHVTVTARAAAPHSFPCVPRARALCIGVNICSHQKRRMPCFLPFRRPGPQFSTIRVSGAIRAALSEPKARKAREGKRKTNERLASAENENGASHAVGVRASSPKSAILVDLAPALLCALFPASPAGGPRAQRRANPHASPAPFLPKAPSSKPTAPHFLTTPSLPCSLLAPKDKARDLETS